MQEEKSFTDLINTGLSDKVREAIKEFSDVTKSGGVIEGDNGEIESESEGDDLSRATDFERSYGGGDSGESSADIFS